MSADNWQRITTVWIVFCLLVSMAICADAVCYIEAKWPERMSVWYWPGSGFVALYRYGRGERRQP